MTRPHRFQAPLGPTCPKPSKSLQINEHLHDREIRLDNGWVIKLGRGLDIYQKPDSWYAIGASDFSLRKCLEIKVDIFRVSST